MRFATAHTFQVLTKRAARMASYTPSWVRRFGDIPEPRWPLPNVWLGVTAENQKAADERIPLLLQTPAAVRFVSAEPLLEAVDFSDYLPLGKCPECDGTGHPWIECGNEHSGYDTRHPCQTCEQPWLDQIIVGGESGPGARPCNVEWIRSIVGQCREAGVACFVKQLGVFAVAEREVGSAKGGCAIPLRLKSRKGNNPDEWPADLRVRETP